MFVFPTFTSNAATTTAVSRIILPKLTSTAKSLEIQNNNALELLSLPQLNSVGLHVLIENNAPLANLSMPQLENIENYLTIQNQQNLIAIDFSELLTVGQSLTLDAISVDVVTFPQVRYEQTEILTYIVGKKILDCVFIVLEYFFIRYLVNWFYHCSLAFVL